MHKLWRTLEFLVMIAAVNAVDYNVTEFGNPPFSKNTPSNPTSYVNLVLLPSQADARGTLFAFSAAINGRPNTLEQFDFQIYRPVLNTLTTFTLIFSLTVTPSVSNQREYYHVESFLGAEPCINILPGDRLGVFFRSTSFATIPLTFYFVSNPTATSTLSDNKPVSVGEMLVLSNVRQPYFVDVTAYYAVNPNSSSSFDSTNITTDCIRGLFVADPNGLNKTQTPSTTPSPIRGIDGIQGQTGLMGVQGIAGRPGVNGSTGVASQSTGVRGIDGNTGPSGATGISGNDTGDTGSTGFNGSAGFTGYTGPTGLEGVVGLNGSVGPMGSNYTITLYGPYAAENTESAGNFFLSTNGIQGLYIWLAIDSFVVIIGLVVIIVTCCFHSNIKNMEF